MYKVVLVDDERSSRNALAQYFTWNNLGFVIEAQFDDGADALRYIRDHPVDVLFCDIVMPNMDGLELARHLHEENNSCIIIFLSAHQDFEFARKALQYGVMEYLVKPLKYDDLITVFTKVKSILDQQSKEAASDFDTILFETNDKIIRAINQYLLDNYQTASLASTSDYMNMNSSYLSSYYYSNSGHHFSDVLTQIRMIKAAQLLNESRHQIQKVAEMVGYTDAKAFSRAFRKYFGKLPKDYRKAY